MEVNQSNKMLKNSKNPCAKCLISRVLLPREHTHNTAFVYHRQGRKQRHLTGNQAGEQGRKIAFLY
jgi:hypothetical protein